MGYYAKENKGEVCAKGYNRFEGYLKDPERTAEAIDKDGWLHTGDIGMWLPVCSLFIFNNLKK
jgi:long-chain acyl-CoA synthetase